jgi:hypothetical protein
MHCTALQTNFNTIVRLDGRVKHHLINLCAKELTATATSEVASVFESLRMGAVTFL